MATIGLVMIVRDESHVIERCLDSVRKLVDFVLIEDTGSTDGTQTIVGKWLEREGVPGEVYDEPWQNFAYNRTHVLATLREKHPAVDYALMLDADDQVVIHDGFDHSSFKASLSHDSYYVQSHTSTLQYFRAQICRNSLPFTYRGVLHEFLQPPPGAGPAGRVRGFHVAAGVEGARSKDPEKYQNDIRILEQALRDETDYDLRSRYVFYLAQSYHDSGEREKALAAYVRRSHMGFWREEVYVSLFNAARLQELLGRPLDAALAVYKNAARTVPERAEAFYGASRLSRMTGRFQDGYDFALKGFSAQPPQQSLFIEPWVYEYGLLDEFAANAYFLGKFDECLDACDRLLTEGKLPAFERERVIEYAEMAKKQMAKGSAVDPHQKDERS